MKEGVKFVLGEPHGKLQDLIRTGNGAEKKVTGIKTCDGLTHNADLVIVACMLMISPGRRTYAHTQLIRRSVDCGCHP